MFIHPSKLAVEYFIIKLVSALEKGRVIIISALYVWFKNEKNLAISVAFRKMKSKKK